MRTLRLVFPLVLTLAGFAACGGGGLVPSDAGPASGGAVGSGGALPGSGGVGPGSGGLGLGGGGLGGDGGGASTGGSESGSGGASDSGCARVHLLIQRSGAMFDYPSAEDNWWDAISEALDGEDGLLGEFGDQLDISASVFTKVQDQECPIGTNVDAPVGEGDLVDVLADEAEAFHALRDPENPDGPKEVGAPVPEAFEASTEQLGDTENAYIVAVLSSIPDSCEQNDNACNIETVFTAVQGAYAAGIQTRVLYLSSDNREGYPEGVANAGAGLGIASTSAINCGTEFPYSETPGSAPFGAPEDTAAVKQALSDLLSGIATSCN